MTDFASPAWFATANDRLTRAGAVPLEGNDAQRIVLEFLDAPASGPHALTLTLDESGARLEAGDHLMADAMLRLAWDDAVALTTGTFDSATALRNGRIKVRGDLSVVVTLLGWLQAAVTPAP